jgi:hypothetical protein
MIKLIEQIMTNIEQEKYFEDRTNRHMEMVKDNAQKIASALPEFSQLLGIVQYHDKSKFAEPERTPYVAMTWNKKCKNEGVPYQYPDGMKEKIEAAIIHHMVSNPHHPEYYNKEQANQIVDATKMPDIAVAEMVADWQAMGEEFGNTAREWFNKMNGKRWKFSPHQEQLIDKLLKVFEGGLIENSQFRAYVKDVRKNISKEFPSLIKQAQAIIDKSNLKGIKIEKVSLSGSYGGASDHEPTEDSDIDIKYYYSGKPVNFHYVHREVDEEDIQSELATLLAGSVVGNYGAYDAHPERISENCMRKVY